MHIESCKLGLEGLPRGGAPKTKAQRMMGTALGFATFIGLSLAVYFVFQGEFLTRILIQKILVIALSAA